MTRLGHCIMTAISLSLGLEESYFATHYTDNPLVLFRIFNYPRNAGSGVGEHTDYGLLTILRQDMSGGLQVKVPVGMDRCGSDTELVRMQYRRHAGPDNRRPLPFSAASCAESGRGKPAVICVLLRSELQRRESIHWSSIPRVRDNPSERWDDASVHDFGGTYGDYVLGKISKVFPELGREVL